MKRSLRYTMAAIAVAVLAMGLAACSKEHRHSLTHHEAAAATCEQSGAAEYWECEACGKLFSDEKAGHEITLAQTVVASPGHQWDEGTETRKPTCTDTGVKTFSCTVCGKTKPELLPAAGHEWDEGTETRKPTCTEKGEKTFTCGVCGKSRTEDISELGHAYEDVAEDPATCTQPGTAAGKRCTRCGHTEGFAPIEPLGHNLEDVAEVPPTCTQPGTAAGKRCTRCDHTEGLAPIEPLGHKLIDVEAVPATCTEDGHAAGKRCERCTFTSGMEVLPAEGHDWDGEWTSDENQHWHVCNRGCGEKGSPAEHVWDEGNVTLPPTTKQTGEQTFSCTACGQTRTETLPMLATYTVDVSTVSLYEGQIGGTAAVTADAETEEDGSYAEGTRITLTVTLEENFGVGYALQNGEDVAERLVREDGVYRYTFALGEDTSFEIAIGMRVTTNRRWYLVGGGNGNDKRADRVDYPWELYTADAALDGDGTAMLLAFDATEMEGDVRAHDFENDRAFASYSLTGFVEWSKVDGAIREAWAKLPAEQRRENYTFAFAIRLIPSEKKREAGFVPSELIYPTALTFEEVFYDMTKEYAFGTPEEGEPSENVATNASQFGFAGNANYLTFLREPTRGAAFTEYGAAYVALKLEHTDGRSAMVYLFNEDGRLYLYSNTARAGDRLDLHTLTDGFCTVGDFNNWVRNAIGPVWSDFDISDAAWSVSTKLILSEESGYVEGDWSDPVSYDGRWET